ncbi:helix-turn-helix domain-containing protein [Paracoccus sp. (in: a-proteobacteria)]|uniref:helix-turn-helix domain-containing protein n=1 Tax=Paracoccus sp. TaxID=267 RepID=UPI002AFFD48D|nr:helix-turn-helix domain-containing protein [Paracoccus sp. (in: a-proteobacteria)]
MIVENTNNLLTVDEAIASLRISRSLFYRKVKAGQIVALKMGRKTLVPTTEITRFIASLPAMPSIKHS